MLGVTLHSAHIWMNTLVLINPLNVQSAHVKSFLDNLSSFDVQCACFVSMLDVPPIERKRVFWGTGLGKPKRPSCSAELVLKQSTPPMSHSGIEFPERLSFLFDLI